MNMEADKINRLNQYFDDVYPTNSNEPHPFVKFKSAEIVCHEELGFGIILGTRIFDAKRDLEGLGVQFVSKGQVGEIRVFSPDESKRLEGTGAIFNARIHGSKTLEQVVADYEKPAKNLPQSIDK